MKFHAVVFMSLVTLSAVFSSCFAHQDPDAPKEAASDHPAIQQPSEAEAATAIPETRKPSAPEATDDSPEVQKTSTPETTDDSEQVQKTSTSKSATASTAVQKPSEAEAIAAAIAYVNREGRMTIQKTEFLAWGTFSEKQVYWPVKLRITYKLQESDATRRNDYAVKVFKDANGKWQAAQYYAWRTDFK